MSSDAENEYFCDGIAEEITSALSKVGQLQVAGRTSAFSFKGKTGDLREIGRTLNVGVVLEGSGEMGSGRSMFAPVSVLGQCGRRTPFAWPPAAD